MRRAIAERIRRWAVMALERAELGIEFSYPGTLALAFAEMSYAWARLVLDFADALEGKAE